MLLITHSQSGPFGWQLGDTRPNLVKGIVSIEPGSSPFETYTGPPFAPGYLPDFPPIPFGLTAIPLTYDPTLLHRKHVSAPNANVSPCILQAEPVRKLVNLARIPMLHIVGEASFHAIFEHCSADYLKQAGVDVDYVPLGEVGIHGNGHFSFMEKNNIEIAEKVVLPWLQRVG